MSTDKSHSHDSHRSIVKSTSIISFGTFVSRILGFVRDILLAKFLGTAAAADAFFVAFRIPNVFRDMLAEGAANSAVVPVLCEYQAESKREFHNFINVIFILSLMFLSAITLAGIAFAPVLVRLVAPGFAVHPGKVELTIQLTRMMFPYLILIGLTAYSIAILTTMRSFVTAAFGPCLLNVAFIVSILLSTHMQESVYGLAIGVLAGGILQLVFQQIPLMRAGIRVERPRSLSFFNHPGARKVGKLFVPRLFGTGIYQLNIFVNTLCASLSTVVGAGGISAIYYADRIIQFPNGVFITALASVILPTLAGQATAKNTEGFKKTLTFSLKNVFFVMLPTMALFLSLSHPIIRILFERGEFSRYSTEITSRALLFYALGLVSFGGVKILVTSFHALQDTATPVKVAGACLMINIILNFILMWPLKIGGIALASSIAMTINFLVLMYRLNQRLNGIFKGIGEYLMKVAGAATAMAAVIQMIWNGLPAVGDLSRLVLAAVLGYVIFGIVCFVFKVDQAVSIVEKIRSFQKFIG